MSTETVTKATAPSAKIYHLSDKSKSSVELYQRVSKTQRVRVDKRPNDRPFLQITFTDVEGLNRTIRFKLNCNTPYQDEQIEKFKIPANEKYTKAERSMLAFKNGVLVVTNKAAQKFLDIHPQNEKFAGDCPDIHGPLFVEFDPKVKVNNSVKEFKRRLEAANKIAALDLEEAQSMLVRLNGSFFKSPEELNDCIDILVEYMDECDEAGIEDILRDGATLEDEIKILINKAIAKDVLSFNEQGMENFVVKKQSGRVIPLKEISKNLHETERRRLFSEFLASNDGSLHLEDLRKIVNVDEPKKEDDKSSKGDAGGEDEKELGKMNKTELVAEYTKAFNEAPDEALTKAMLIEAIEKQLVT